MRTENAKQIRLEIGRVELPPIPVERILAALAAASADAEIAARKAVKQIQAMAANGAQRP